MDDYKNFASGTINGILMAGLFLPDDALGSLLESWAQTTAEQIGLEETGELCREAVQVADRFKHGYSLRIAAIIRPPTDN